MKEEDAHCTSSWTRMLWAFIKRMLHFTVPPPPPTSKWLDGTGSNGNNAPPPTPAHVILKVHEHDEQSAAAPADETPPAALRTAPSCEEGGAGAQDGPSPPHTAAPPQTQPSAPRALAAAQPYVTRQYVIGGLTFEVDTRYAIKAVIGKGAYGLVCAADDTLAGVGHDENGGAEAQAAPSKVAVKKILDPFHDHTDSKRLLREVRLLRCLRHPNVLHLLDLMPPPTLSPDNWRDVYLVTRLFDTNLHRVIYSGQPLTDPHVQYILWQLFRALRYLHAGGVIHRDMKPTNLLLNRDCELALADFGLARYMPQLTERRSSMAINDEQPRGKSGQLTKYVVTRWYRAPELLVQNRKYDAKVDMWSVGCILAEVIGAKAIFPGKDSLHQLKIIVETMGTPAPSELAVIENEQAVNYIKSLKQKESSLNKTARQRLMSLYPKAEPALLDLLSQLLQFDPAKRPTAAEALAHPYLAAYRDAPEEDLPTPEIEMDFETASPTKEELRQLVFEEVLRYHPELQNTRV